MALTNSYLIATKNLEGVINSVTSAKAPERFTNRFLEDLGYKSSNDRLFVGMFRALGLIDDMGQPTQRYFDFIDQTQTSRILADGIREAYEDLFNLRRDAYNLSYDEVKNKFKTLTQGQKSDNVLSNMTSTFRALCSQADWSKPTQNSQRVPEEKPNVRESTNATADHTNLDEQVKKMNLHYNIQIHLPETSNMSVYDAIFQSLKKHLL